MKQQLPAQRLRWLAILPILITACYSPKYYTYNAQLVSPIQSDSARFENDTMAVAMTLLPKYIKLDIRNKMPEGIKINWSDVALSIGGVTQKITHYEVGATKKKAMKPSPIIAPHSSIAVGLIVGKKVRFRRVYGQRVLYSRDIYPVSDKGKKQLRTLAQSKDGNSISIYVPYYLNEKYHYKTFELLVDVTEQSTPIPTSLLIK
jgi:hypothetical protein